MQACFVVISCTAAAWASELRIGIIGLDGSHCIQLTRRLNNAAEREHVPGAKVVGAFKGGSPDVPHSWSRVEGFSQEISEKYGVRIHGSIEELVRGVDGVLILSIDGRAHLPQARVAIAHKKPFFIDKPMAASVREAMEIFRLARDAGVPCFSASSHRYGPEMEALKQTKIGELRMAVSLGPATIEPYMPDLFWYGIHSVEALYLFMGQGCRTVVRTHTEHADVVTGIWPDGRVGTVLGTRNTNRRFAITLYGSENIAERPHPPAFQPLLHELIRFFKTGIVPIPPEETLEILAFMEAADESKRRGGTPVAIEEILRPGGK